MKWTIVLTVLLMWAACTFAESTWSLVVCHSNDVHGGIDSSDATFMNAEFPPELGGGASAARLVHQLRTYAKQKNAGFLLMDTGDIFQGTLVGTKSHGEAVMRYMNEIGYDLWVFGNHEFDLGRSTAEALMHQSDFATLSANVYDTTAGVWTHVARPYIIKDCGPVKVAVIGITTGGTVREAFAENIKNLYFAPEVTTLAAYRDTVRALGADIVIAACHLGLPYNRWEAWDELEKHEKEGWKSDYARNAFELARRVPGIDILFAGDIHVGYQEPWVDPVTHTPCFQGYGRGTNLLCVEFKFDLASKKLLSWKPFAEDGSLITLLSDRFPRDRKVAETIDTVKSRVEAGYDEKIGEAVIAVTRTGENESLLGNLICDAMCWKLKGALSLTNKGGVRTDLPMGTITPRDVFNVLPFDNTLCTVPVTGRFMRDLVEDKVAYGGSGLYVSGLRVHIDKAKPRGQRVVEIEIGGKPVVLDSTYRLVTTDYLLEGNSGMTKLATMRNQAAIETGVYMRDAVIEYIKDHSPLDPKLDGRWTTTEGTP